MIDSLGCAGGSFIVIDPRTMVMDRRFDIQVDTKLSDQYATEELWRIDPQTPYACNARQSGWFMDSDYHDPNDAAAAHHNLFMRENVGWGHHITALACLNGGATHVGLSMFRKSGDGATPVAEQQKLAAIMPEIARAIELGFVQSEKLADAYWAGASASRSEPALLLDHRSRVIRISDR